MLEVSMGYSIGSCFLIPPLYFINDSEQKSCGCLGRIFNIAGGASVIAAGVLARSESEFAAAALIAHGLDQAFIGLLGQKRMFRLHLAMDDFASNCYQRICNFTGNFWADAEMSIAH